jgi:hypothetical protein
MKTLVIHPSDPSTTFLTPIYSNIPAEELTLITGGINKKEIIELVKICDTIICLGHGFTQGLYALGKFKEMGYTDFIIDKQLVPYLTNKKLITIWCYAKEFIDSTDLKNVYTSNMFCSEVAECNYVGLKNTNQAMVDESNLVFGVTLGKFIHLEPKEIHEAMQKSDYATLVKSNLVAAYNMERLSYVNKY